MGKARDWGDVGAEGGPGAIRRKGDDPATDIPVDDAPPAQTNGEAYFSEEELRGPPDGPSNWQTPGEGVSLDDFLRLHGDARLYLHAERRNVAGVKRQLANPTNSARR